MLDKQHKTDVIKQFATHDGDTGSSQVQVALLTERIAQIAEHLKSFPKDKHSRHGLVKLVGKRRSHTNYLRRSDREAYDQVMSFIKNKKNK